MKRILIANLASPANPGDHAILSGTLKLVREHFPGVLISLSTRAYSQKAAYDALGCQVVPAFPDVDRLNQDDSLMKLLRVPAALMNPWPLIRAVNDSDAVFLAGGAYFYSYRKSFPGLTYLAHVSPVLWAAFKKRKVVFLPQSYGPFLSKTAQGLFRSCLHRADKIFYREDFSGEFLKRDFPECAGRFTFMPDHALYLTREDLLPGKDAGTPEIGRKRVGVTIRPWNSGGQDSAIYLESLAHSLAKYALQENMIVRIIVQVQDEKKMEGDEAISKRLEARLMEILPRDQVEFFSKKPYFTLSEISRLYSECHLMVSMRLHSALLSYILGCPALVAGYQHKAAGILARMGLDDLYMGAHHEIGEQTLMDRLRAVHAGRADYTKRIETALAEARAQISGQFKECLR